MMPHPVLFLVYLFEFHVLTKEEVQFCAFPSSTALLCLMLGIGHDFAQSRERTWRSNCLKIFRFVSLGLVLLPDMCIMWLELDIILHMIFKHIIKKGVRMMRFKILMMGFKHVYKWVHPFVGKMGGGDSLSKKDMNTHYLLIGRSTRKMDDLLLIMLS